MSDHAFDKSYWDAHWASGRGAAHGLPANPHLTRETAHLAPGAALDAGCGAGAEALWLAARGWRVTGADISRTALDAAAERAQESPHGDRVDWVETDVAVWDPGRQWDLVVTSYAHPSIPQLAFYRRIAQWVAPGGTLLVIGHLHAPGPGSHHPAEAAVVGEDIAALFAPSAWSIETSRESSRHIAVPGGRTVTLHDVVVRARRSPGDALAP